MTDTLSLPVTSDKRRPADTGQLSALLMIASICFAAAAVAITWRTWTDIYIRARDDTESGQVFVAPLAFLWIAWARRAMARRSIPQARLFGRSLIGPAVAAIGWLAWSTGFYRGPDVLCECGAVLLVAGAAMTFLADRSLRQLWPAFLALGFAIPVTGPSRHYISSPLQAITARITQSLCEVIGMNVNRLGNVLQINGREVEIAEACNGLRMIWPLFIVTYLFAFITPVRPWLRAVVLLGSPLIAVVANVVRLVPTVWVYGHCRPTAASIFHEAAGWAMLLVAFAGLVGISRILPWAYPAEKAVPGGLSAPGGPRANSRRSRAALPLAAALTCLLLAGAGWTSWKMPIEADSTGYHAAVIQAGREVPLEIGRWVGHDIPPDEGTMALLSPNLIISREYVDRDSHLSAHVLLVQVKDPRAILYHTPAICYTSQGWEPAGGAPREWMVDGMKLSGSEYEYWRSPFQHSSAIFVADMMLLPDGQVVADIGPVRQHARSVVQRFFGAAHLEIVCDASIASRDRQAMVEEILAGYIPLIRTIGSGRKWAAI